MFEFRENRTVDLLFFYFNLILKLYLSLLEPYELSRLIEALL